MFSFSSQDNYGKSDPDAVKIIKDLYNELNLQNVFADYEDKSYERILELIQSHSSSLPQEMFLAIVKKIYKRNK